MEALSPLRALSPDKWSLKRIGLGLGLGEVLGSPRKPPEIPEKPTLGVMRRAPGRKEIQKVNSMKGRKPGRIFQKKTKLKELMINSEGFLEEFLDIMGVSKEERKTYIDQAVEAVYKTLMNELDSQVNKHEQVLQLLKRYEEEDLAA